MLHGVASSSLSAGINVEIAGLQREARDKEQTREKQQEERGLSGATRRPC